MGCYASIDADQLARLVWRATPLWDRDPTRASSGDVVDRSKRRTRICRWREVLGDAAILRSRLKGSSTPSALLERVLGETGKGALPSWALVLQEVLRRGADWQRHDRSFQRLSPLPFQEVLVGFVQYGREALTARAGSALKVMASSALVAVERQLLGHLTFVAALTVGMNFYTYRFSLAPAAVFEGTWRERPRSSRIYRSYVRHMHAGGLFELLDAHPVLARLLSQAVDQWVSAVAEFCSRFLDDFAVLQRDFVWGVRGSRGAVLRLEADLSDRHRDGRMVLACRLSGGERVIYKPRSVQPEKAFYRFIEWLNGERLSHRFRQLRVVDRGTHGWMEMVEFKPCRTVAGVQRFYRRAGMMLCALHALATTDVHRENLIANGEQPVVVDLETLLNDAVSIRRLGGARLDKMTRSARPTVMSTGMLPFWRTSSGEREADMSALGSDDGQTPGLAVFAWHAVNTDQMTISMESLAPATRMTHRVYFDGKHPSALEHLSSLLSGFQEVYDCLLDNRDRLASASWLNMFDALNLRILVRSTVTYTRLQLHSLHPEFLQDGLDRSIELEWLARPLSPRVKQEGPQRVYECERTSMERLDIPHFATADWRGAADAFDDEEMRCLFGQRDSQVLIRRLQGLSRADCRRQLAIIEKAVRRRFANGPVRGPASEPTATRLR